VRKKASAEDLTVEELRRLLVEKRRSARQERIEHFRRTGRVVTLVSDADAPSLDNLRSNTVSEESEAGEKVPFRSHLRRFFDGFLLVVEVGALLGLFFVVFNGLEILRDLNQEMSSVLELPTLTPTPLILAVVLPSGHTPPNSPGGAQANDAEIPEHLRPLVQSLANIPVPTPGPEQAISIQIPAIHIENKTIVQGDGWEQLKKGVGQHIGSANPGESSNVVLTAHNDIFGEIFRDLDLLKPGDEVILVTNQHTYTYLVVDTKIVEPTQVEVMDPTKDPIVTLISCYPYLVDNKRIVVTASLQSSSR